MYVSSGTLKKSAKCSSALYLPTAYKHTLLNYCNYDNLGILKIVSNLKTAIDYKML